jgi:hypothetical protein
MPNGPEYVASTLEQIKSASAQIGGLAGVEEDWKSEAQERLAAVVALLEGMGDRYFLKTRVCLPFARKCDAAAQALNELLAGLSDAPEGGAPDARQQVSTALEALEKTARTLDERSMMQGMAIT